MPTLFAGRRDEVLREDVAKNVTPAQLNKDIAPRSRQHEHAALLPSLWCHLAMKKPDYFFCEEVASGKANLNWNARNPDCSKHQALPSLVTTLTSLLTLTMLYEHNC